MNLTVEDFSDRNLFHRTNFQFLFSFCEIKFDLKDENRSEILISNIPYVNRNAGYYDHFRLNFDKKIIKFKNDQNLKFNFLKIKHDFSTIAYHPIFKQKGEGLIDAYIHFHLLSSKGEETEIINNAAVYFGCSDYITIMLIDVERVPLIVELNNF